MHRWRVVCLAFMVQFPFDEFYIFGEPWNSPNNARFASGKPMWKTRSDGTRYTLKFDADMDICPDDRHSQPTLQTNCVAITGPGTAFPKDSTTSFSDFTDGTGNTVLIAEIINSGIRWTEPRDLYIDDMSFVINDPSKPSISSYHREGPALVFADASVYRVSASIRPDVLKALFTINGSEPIDRLQLINQGVLH